MSTGRSSKQHKYNASWKVMEICNILEMYLDDPKVDYLISAEYDLRNLIDYMTKEHDPHDPPF